MNSLKKNAAWFSRHPMTEAQKREAFECGYVLCQVDAVTKLAEVEINNEADLQFVVCQLYQLCNELEIAAIFGVFAAPMQAYIVRCAIEKETEEGYPSLPCYAAWNVKRSPEGGKPTFEHKQFVFVGEFTDAEIELFIR